tara:strand:+ start:100 stop:369 length:270 start_codon:yes stop_codon:yes gene_type:complete
MKSIFIRKTVFECIFKNVLSVNYAQNWNCYDTKDKKVNPLVRFETKKWNKLILLCKNFINKSTDIYDIERGMIKGFIHKYELEVKYGKI